MSTKSLSRIQYRQEDGTPRPGPTERKESLLDTEQFLVPLSEVEASSRFSPGIVEGLEVRATLGNRELTVSSGVALDADGRLIVLAKDGWVTKEGTTDQVDQQDVRIDTSALTDGTYVIQIEWFESPGAISGLPVLRHAPKLLLADPDAEGPSGIPLALVTVHEKGRVAELSHQKARRVGRLLSGLHTSRIDLYAPASTSTGDSVTSTSERQGSIGALAEGGIEILTRHSRLAISTTKRIPGFDLALGIVSLQVPSNDTLEFTVGSGPASAGLSIDRSGVYAKANLRAPGVMVWDGGVQLTDGASGKTWIISSNDAGHLVIGQQRDGQQIPKVEFMNQGIRLHGDVEILGNLSVHGTLEYETARKV